MFIANKNFISTETRMILQESKRSLINLYRAMRRADVTKIEEAGQTIERYEVLKGAALIGKILDICI